MTPNPFVGWSPEEYAVVDFKFCDVNTFDLPWGVARLQVMKDRTEHGIGFDLFTDGLDGQRGNRGTWNWDQREARLCLRRKVCEGRRESQAGFVDWWFGQRQRCSR